MTYNPSFDIVRSCKDAKEIDFIWHGIDEVKTDDGIIMRQVNNVMRCTAFRRRTKRLAKLSDAQIDFGVISSEMAERKLRSQRQVRVRDPKTNMLVYFSGNILCVGARSKLCAVAGMHLSARLMHNYLKSPSAEFVIGSISCVNRVFTGSLKKPINLGQLQTSETMTWRYEPDLFPGAIGNFSVDVEVAPPPGTVMLFESGNFVLAGAGNTQCVRDAVAILMKTIRVMPSYNEPPSTVDMPVPTVDQQSLRRNRMWRRYHAQWTAGTEEDDTDEDMQAVTEALELIHRPVALGAS